MSEETAMTRKQLESVLLAERQSYGALAAQVQDLKNLVRKYRTVVEDINSRDTRTLMGAQLKAQLCLKNFPKV